MLQDRDTELELVDKGLRAAAAGKGSLIVVGGAPGVGRSTLLGHTAASAASQQARLLRADGIPPEQDFAFGIVRQLFQPLVLDASETQLARWFHGPAKSARRMFFDDSWSAGGSHRTPAWEILLHGLHSMTVNLSADKVALVVVDDLQWADPQSFRWLAYLAKRLGDARIMIVCAISDGHAAPEQPLLRELVASATHLLRPGPLSVSGAQSMISEEFGEDCHHEFALACHTVARGNPALLVAVIRGLHAKGFRPVGEQAEEVDTASQALLRERRMFWLSTQPRVVRDVAMAMVVLGGLANPELISDLVGLDDAACRSALQALGRLGLLAEPESPQFAHPSIEFGIEAAMTADVRERMHRRAAALLHDAGYAAEHVAAQLLLVAPKYERWETDVLRSAAGAALERGSGKPAARYLRRALVNSPPEGQGRGRLLVDLAAAERGFDLASSVRHVSQALLVLESAPERAAAALWIPPAVARADPALAELVRAAASRLADQDPAGMHRELALRLEARTRYLGVQDAVELNAAVDRLRQLGTGAAVSTSAERELLAVLTYAATVTGGMRADEVSAFATRILEREPPVPGHAYTALPVLVPALVAADVLTTLTPWLHAAWDEVQRQGSGGVEVKALVDAERGAVACARGQLTQARDIAMGVLESVGAAGEAWPEATAIASSTLAAVALETQDVELGERVLLHGEATGDLHSVVTRRMLRAMADAVRGDLSVARDRFLDCGRQLARCGWTNPALFPWRVWAAALCQRLGDIDSAAVLAGEEHDAAQAWGAPAAHGRALRLRGMLTGGTQGIDLLREAVDMLRRSEDRIELSRAATILGRRLLVMDSPEARDFLAEGKRIAKECGVSWVERNEEAELNGPVLQLVPSYLAELTRSEQTIMTLVVRGWTNQRVADLLGITRRAVEKNLTSIYRKMGVNGRAALVEELGAMNVGDAAISLRPSSDTKRMAEV